MLNTTALLEGSPADFRYRMLSQLMERHGGDMAFYGTFSHGEAGWVAVGALPIGPPDFVACWQATDGVPLGEQGVDIEHFWDFNTFAVHDRRSEPPKVVEHLWKPFGITDTLAMNVCRGSEYLGSVSIYRTEGSPRFTQADARRAAEDVPMVRQVLEAADDADTRMKAPVGAHVLDANGKLMFTVPGQDRCPDGVRMLEAAAREFLAARRSGELLIGHSVVSMSHLNGPTGAAVLAIVRPVHRCLVPDILHLTRLKRTIATYASHGATIAEIASAMSRKPETIRAHLKDIYSKLGVSSRVELAELVDRARATAPASAS